MTEMYLVIWSHGDYESHVEVPLFVVQSESEAQLACGLLSGNDNSYDFFESIDAEIKDMLLMPDSAIDYKSIRLIEIV